MDLDYLVIAEELCRAIPTYKQTENNGNLVRDFGLGCHLVSVLNPYGQSTKPVSALPLT